MNEKINIGKILKPKGLKGELKIRSYSFDLLKYNKIYVEDKIFDVVKIYFSNGFYYATLSNINTIYLAEELRNKNIYILKKDLYLQDNEYLIEDIIGSKIILNNCILGTVLNIDNFGSADVYNCVDIKGKKFMFPFISKVIDCINIEKKEIQVNDHINEVIV